VAMCLAQFLKWLNTLRLESNEHLGWNNGCSGLMLQPVNRSHVLLQIILKTGSIVTAWTGVIPDFSMDKLHVLVHVSQILATLRALALDVGGDNLIEVKWWTDHVWRRALGVGEP